MNDDASTHRAPFVDWSCNRRPLLHGIRGRLFAAALVLLGPTPAVLGQTVVPVHEEPRHHLVHEGDSLRVLDVRIPPGDTTLFHRHENPIAYVSIGVAPVNAQVLGRPWGRTPALDAPRAPPGRITTNESYASEPVSHRVTAVGDTEFRLIAVVNPGPGDGGRASRALGALGPPESAGRWFATAHRTLEPGDTLAWTRHDRPVVVVLVAEGRVGVGPGAGETAAPEAGSVRLTEAGAFEVLVAGRRYTVTNRGSVPATLAFVEVR